MKPVLFGLVLLGLAGAKATAQTNATATGYIQNFEVPERDEDGNLRWKLRGDRGQFLADGKMLVERLRAEFYASNRVEFVFTADAATLDQVNKQANTDTPIRLEGANLIITGTGADWTGASNTFVVRSNVHVIISPERSLP